jgi:hypothetical protein
VVDNCGDSAADVAVTKGQKGLNFSVVVKRVPPVIDQFLLIHPQWRHPVGVATVKLPWKSKKLLFSGPGGNCLNLYRLAI